MTTLKAYSGNPSITFSGAGLPSFSTIGARVDDVYLDTITGEAFTCVDATFGSQAWRGSQGTKWPADILAFDHANLVAAYTMDNISGSTLIDESPNVNNGTISGAVAVTGKIGDALSFDGTDDLVDGIGPIPDAYSTSFWFKANKTATGGATQIIYSQQNSNDIPGADYRGFLVSGAGLIQLFSRNTSNDYEGVPTLAFTDDVWSHVYCQEVGVNLLMRFNDSSETTLIMPSSRTGWGTDCNAGRLPSAEATTLAYGGLLDHFRIFDRTLTQPEITALYNEGLVA